MYNAVFNFQNEILLMAVAELMRHPLEYGGAHRNGHRAGGAWSADGVAQQAIH